MISLGFSFAHFFQNRVLFSRRLYLASLKLPVEWCSVNVDQQAVLTKLRSFTWLIFGCCGVVEHKFFPMFSMGGVWFGGLKCGLF